MSVNQGSISSLDLEVLVIKGEPVSCVSYGLTKALAICPDGYKAVGGGCYGVCINVGHPNGFPVNDNIFKCEWWTDAQDQRPRTLQATVTCIKLKR